MDSTKLREMIKEHQSMMSFADKVGIPYTTLVSSLKSDAQLSRMPINNFISVAHGLGMTADELIDVLMEDEEL